MVITIRVMCTERREVKEVNKLINTLTKVLSKKYVVKVSKPYPNRGGGGVRIYIDLRRKGGGSSTNQSIVGLEEVITN